MNDRSAPLGRSFDPNRSLSHGVAAMRAALGPMWIAGLLLSISDGCAGVPVSPASLWKPHAGSFAALPHAGRGWPALHELGQLAFTRGSAMGALVLGVAVMVLAALVLVVLLLFVLGCWLRTGCIRLHTQILEHGDAELAPLFSGGDRFWPMLRWKLLSSTSISGSALVAAWPGLMLALYGLRHGTRALIDVGLVFALLLALPVASWVALGTFLGECAIVLEQAPAVLALRRSFALARHNRWPLLFFVLVGFAVRVVSALGFLLCCVGALFTVPLARAIVDFARTESYLLCTRGWFVSEGWQLWQREQAADAALLPASPPPDAPSEPPSDKPAA